MKMRIICAVTCTILLILCNMLLQTTEEEPKVKKKKIISKEDREKHVRAKRKKEIRVISAVRTDVITEPSVLMRKVCTRNQPELHLYVYHNVQA